MKPFEPNKTAEELGIDKTRKFVVVKELDGIPFKVGDTISLERDDNSRCPRFGFVDGRRECFYFNWSHLAYADEPDVYKPMVGDRVSLEGEIVKKYTDGTLHVEINGTPVVVMTKKEYSQMNLLSRKTRTLTKAEAEAMLAEKLGESVRIE